MKNYFKEICSLFPIRRTKEQKSAFFDYVAGEFEPNRVKKDILEKEHENIVIGDIESAKVIFTAHYDTPATSIVPNLMMPANKIINYVYHLGYPLILALLSLAIAFGIGHLLSFELHYTVALYLVIYFVAFFAATRMVTNKNNVNDNTSGVATVLTLAKQINKKEVAFVLFDNEEKGLLGSKAMNKKYKDLLKDKLVINFDCIANGNEIIFIAKAGAETREQTDRPRTEGDQGIYGIANHKTTYKVAHNPNRRAAYRAECHTCEDYWHILKAEAHNVPAPNGKIFAHNNADSHQQCKINRKL